MVSALSLAQQGFEVHQVEKTSQLGGIATRHHHTLEGLDIKAYLEGLIDQVTHEPLIHIYRETDIVDVNGYVGNFTTKLQVRPEGEVKEVKHGVTIIATGGDVYGPNEYLYGQDERVFTLLEL